MVQAHGTTTPTPGPATESPIVPHKLRMPSPTGLRRSRLEGRLLDSLDCGQVLVVAPPGAGKTTLLSQVAAATRLPVAWYSAGVEEADAAVLVRYLARALWHEQPPPLGPGASVDELLAAIGDGGRFPPSVLVADDLHELAGTPAEHALARFLEHRPSQLRILLGARRPPGFNTPRMMASGSLVEFDGDDLRFRSWEVEELFRDLYQEPLSPESAALLTRRVGGFAAALQLFHLSTRGRTRVDREAQILQLSGRSPLIRSYLARTVLDSLSAERRDFLVRTSVLGILHSDVCDTLLGRTDSAAVLRDLARDQLFTTTDDGGLSYQYHQVLRNHLEVTLEDELPAAEVTALHLRAAGLLEANGCPAAALRAYQRAGDWGSAGRLVRQTHTAAPAHESGAGSGPGQSVPGGDPWLGLARARGLLRLGSVDAAIRALDHLQHAVDDPDLVRLCAQERQYAGLWQPGPLRLSAELAAAPLGPIRSLTHTLPDALPGIAGPTASATDDLVLVLSKIVRGEFAGARSMFARSSAFPEAETWVRLSATLLDVMLELTEPDGDSRGPARLEDLSLNADLEGYPWIARLARGLQACVMLEQTGEAWRRRTCDSVIDACIRDGDRWGELLLRMFTAVTLARIGELADARAGFAYATGLCRELDAPVLNRWVHGYLTALERPPGTGLDATTGDRPDHLDLLDACRVSLQPRSEQLDSPTPKRRLRCLGGFRLSHGDLHTDLAPLRPRARLLLMRLAIQHGTDVHREHLIDALWPDVALGPGLRRLQVAVSSVRQLLEREGWGAGCVQRRGEAYRLELPDTEVDLQRLEATVAEIGGTTQRRDAAWVERASSTLLEVYRGDLLPEVGAAEWVLAERDRLQLISATALAILGQIALGLGRPDLALAPTRRLVDLDPLRDTAWQLLAEIHRALGNPTAAEVTLTEYHRVEAQLRHA